MHWSVFRHFRERPKDRIIMKKLYLFLTTLLLGGAIMSYKLFDTNFSSEGIQEWALDALLIAAILGFIAMKWLKHKGKLD